MKIIHIIFLTALLISCNSSESIESKTKSLNDIEAFSSDSTVNVVIEIPAGTILKTEYDKKNKKFSVERLSDGSLRRIKFLPYPGNYGFIPSTEMSIDTGGDGDPLDILLLAEAIPQGKVIESIPIALLKLEDDEELDYKIIAVPKVLNLQIIDCRSYACLQEKFPAIASIIELWFLHYKGNNKIKVIGWEDEKSAFQEIKKWEK